MKKLTKAAIAGAAGIALLLGGAGSLAFWNASANVAGGTITAGELTITAANPEVPGTWTVSNGTIVNGAIADITSFRAVPGDVLTYTKDFAITAVGNNLKASVGITGDSITAATPLTPANTALAAALRNSVITRVNTAEASTLTLVPGNQILNVSAQITWPFDTPIAPAATSPESDNPAMNGAVDLSAMTITLTQIAP